MPTQCLPPLTTSRPRNVRARALRPPCHPERSGELHVSRAVERVLRASAPATNSFAVFGTAYYPSQDPSTWSLAPLAPSVGMTEEEYAARYAHAKSAPAHYIAPTQCLPPALYIAPHNARTRALARGIETNSLSLQTNTQKRKNHTFSFFPL